MKLDIVEIGQLPLYEDLETDPTTRAMDRVPPPRPRPLTQCCSSHLNMSGR
jgi:hypothetical protein